MDDTVTSWEHQLKPSPHMPHLRRLYLCMPPEALMQLFSECPLRLLCQVRAPQGSRPLAQARNANRI